MVTINTPTNSGVQGMLYVTEGNLYRTIFQSHKPETDRFTDWVTEEVLSSIRKTGRYENKPMTMAENLAAQAQLLVEQEKRIARIEQRVETALTAIARPSADTWMTDMAEAMKRYCEAKGLPEITGRGGCMPCWTGRPTAARMHGFAACGPGGRKQGSGGGTTWP